ncbi:MAG TPA: hypothetical protein VL356_05805 [Acidocella sp.]|jgi:hypothetical protein|nr:hypothetical protein [Acidocella sp.]
MRRTTMFTLLGLVALPGIAVAQTTTAPSTTTTNPPMAAPQGGTGMGDHQHWHHHGKWREAMRKFHKKFDAANTTHDGHLTLAQAEKAGMTKIVKNFNAIDTQHRGYVTFNDVVAWRLDTMAAHMEKRAAELRAKD